MTLLLSQHAVCRKSQRGVTAGAIEIVLDYGDCQIPVGKGCVSISVSRSRARQLARRGEIEPRLVDRLSNLVVVVANDNDEVVTVLHPQGRRKGRSYRNTKGYSRRNGGSGCNAA